LIPALNRSVAREEPKNLKHQRRSFKRIWLAKRGMLPDVILQRDTANSAIKKKKALHAKQKRTGTKRGSPIRRIFSLSTRRFFHESKKKRKRMMSKKEGSMGTGSTQMG